MVLPTLTADASLYRSERLYGGYSGQTSLDTASAVVAAATPCFSHVQKCCGQINPDGTCDGICWPKNLPCPITPPPICNEPLGDQVCYPSVDGTNIKICQCGSTGNCGPCFHLTATVFGTDRGVSVSRHQAVAVRRPARLRYLCSKEDRDMMTSGFSGEMSLYQSSLAYCQFAIAADHEHQLVRPAQDSCTCTSPNCTWSCPPPPPPDPCAGLSGCALRRCICAHEPSCKLVGDSHPPCFFHCFCL